MNYKKIAAFLSAAAISVCLLISCDKSTAKKEKCGIFRLKRSFQK